MSLATIQRKLSREEMKQIMAGNVGNGSNCDGWCTVASQCKQAGCGNVCSNFNGQNVCWWIPFT